MTENVFRDFQSSDRDWLVDEHRCHYAASDGFDASFVELVEQVVDGFLVGHTKNREAGWIVETNGKRLGSVFCMKLTEEVAQLRLFFLVADARGTGLGLRLLKTCMGFAKSAGYSEMKLWTHESNKAACRLYRDSGWMLIEAKPARSFGQDVVVQSWVYRF